MSRTRPSLIKLGVIGLLASGGIRFACAADVELTHQLGADKGAQLQKLVDRFNADQGSGLRIRLSDRAIEPGKLPDMAIVAELDQERLVAVAKHVKPVWQVMQDAGERLDTLAPPKMLVPAMLDRQGRLVALPVGLATPLVYFNKKTIAAAGLDPDAPPATWIGWQGILGKLAQGGASCPFTVSQPVSALIENTSAWHNQAMVRDDGKGEEFVGNGLTQVKHVAFMTTWYKSRYMRYFGRGSDAESRFANGECAVLVAPSSAHVSLQRAANFDIGITAFPYHDGAYGAPQNTLADGPSLWVASGRSAAEYKTIARFLSFMMTPETQVEWMVNAGYLPLSQAGIFVLGSKLLKDDLAAQRLALAQLTMKPATTASAGYAFTHRPGVRRILAEEMEMVFADRKPSKQALDDAVKRIRARERGCCQALF